MFVCVLKNTEELDNTGERWEYEWVRIHKKCENQNNVLSPMNREIPDLQTRVKILENNFLNTFLHETSGAMLLSEYLFLEFAHHYNRKQILKQTSMNPRNCTISVLFFDRLFSLYSNLS